jgi:hypothetical protein
MKNTLFISRKFVALVLSVSGLSVAMLSFAGNNSRDALAAVDRQAKTSQIKTTAKRLTGPTVPNTPSPASGTLTPSSPTITYTDGPLVENPTGILGAPICPGAPNTCSDFTVTINASALSATHNFTWSVQWPVPNVDMDIFVEDANHNLIQNNNSTTDPSAITLPIPPDGTVYHLVVSSSVGTSILTGTATLEPKYPTAQQGQGAPPRYMHYPAGPGQADGANEPSIGVDWNPNVASLKHDQVNTGGVAFFTVGSNEYRVNFDDCSSPAKNLWEDVSATFTQTFVLSDPIGFVDHFSPQTALVGVGSATPHTPGRVFTIDLIGGQGNSLGSFSDDDGNSYLPGGNGGAPEGPDHETLGGGPYHAPVPTPPAPAYQNVIYYCSQNGVQNAECSASYDGGQTFGPGVPLFNPTVCGGGIHGHVKVSPQGTAYVPNSSCAAGTPLGANGVGVSTDNGATWNEFNVPNSTGSEDPAVGIGQNNVGKPAGQVPNTIYLGWISADNHAHIAHSPDEGATWFDDIDVSSIFGIGRAVFPIVVAGDDNRAAYAFLGTYPAITDHNVWHLYVATTYDGGHSWILTDTTPDDPVQIGDVCLLGLACTSANRNLLDFNGIDIDSQGRVLIGYTDGCLNCSNNQNISQSSQAHAVVARQSGGRRLFAAFDPVEPGPPGAPQIVSAVRQSSPAGVAVTWLKPDNGGAPIIGYNVYRSTSSGTETMLASVSGENTNKYLDTSADSSTNYFYRVTALNSFGNSTVEGPFCREVSIVSTGTSATACVAPFIQVQGAAAATNDPTGQFSIQHVNMGEPFVNCSTKQLTATMKVNTMDPSNTGTAVTPPVSTYEVYFKIPGSANSSGQPQTLFLEYDNTTQPQGVFLAGWIDPGTGSDCSTIYLPNDPTNPVTGTVGADGTITMNLNLSSTVTFGSCNNTAPDPITITPSQWISGVQITHIQGITYQRAGGVITGARLTKAQTTGDGTYTTIGNVSGCNTLVPLALLSATPMSGPASTNFSFDGRSSFEPVGACGTINSYTLDFGDGSAAVTNSTGTFSHTYSSPGDYPARLTVHDSVGHASVNQAQVIIQVTGGVPPLSGVVSRRTHGGAGDYDIILTPSAPFAVESRSADANGNYTLVFSFQNTLNTLTPVTSISATATTSSGTVNLPAPTGSLSGTDAHLYTVTVSGVPNASYLVVTLNGVTDSAANHGNVSAEMGVLLGDVNGSARVDAADVSSVRQQTLQTITTSNFRNDINTSGRIDAADVSVARQQTLTSLPPTP